MTILFAFPAAFTNISDAFALSFLFIKLFDFAWCVCTSTATYYFPIYLGLGQRLELIDKTRKESFLESWTVFTTIRSGPALPHLALNNVSVSIGIFACLKLTS